MLVRDDVNDEDVARLAIIKFELVNQGTANRIERIERYLAEIGADYNAVVLALFPRARPYPEAFEIVWPRIKFLIP
jgi:hypothetical protein